MSTPTEIPKRVAPLFVEAGWYPGRHAVVSTAAILAEFGGLTVGRTGDGEECAASDVAFGEITLDESIIDVWGQLLETRLVGVAEVHHSHGAHGELQNDGFGRSCGASQVQDAFWFAGASFGEAMERLLLGRRSPPCSPYQPAVSLSGSNSPQIIRACTDTVSRQIPRKQKSLGLRFA